MGKSVATVLTLLLIFCSIAPIQVVGSTSSQIDERLFVGGQEGSILEGSMLTVNGEGGSHMCIILAMEEIYCRGGNMYGQLGNGQSYQQPGFSSNYVDLPENISVINEITSGQEAYTCAIVNNGQVICWGTIGDWEQFTPVFFDLPANRSAVSILRTSVILDNGDLYCIFGGVCSFGHAIEDPILAIGGGYSFMCAALQNMTIYCYGTISGEHNSRDHWIELDTNSYANLSNSSFSMTVGYQHVCYLQLTYQNPPSEYSSCYGQIRLPENNVHQQWMTIPASSDAVAITSGRNHHCALMYNGSVYCTGSDQHGQLGRGSYQGPSNQFSYVELPGDLVATSIYAHSYGTCAIASNYSTTNYLYCWGLLHLHNQNYDKPTPTLISLNSGIKQISRDVDNDGILNNYDLCNFGEFNWTSNSSTDFDGDGCKDDSEDIDDDNDRHVDFEDLCPISDYSIFNSTDIDWGPPITGDSDNDGCHNTEDLDDDNDGFLDEVDFFPFDSDEWADNDGDGATCNWDLPSDTHCGGDNSDTDDDNDGWSDAWEYVCLTDSLSSDSVPIDTDGDAYLQRYANSSVVNSILNGTITDFWEWNNVESQATSCDIVDIDDDGDYVNDTDDAFPLNPYEWADADQDGIGDNGDDDDDNDGWIDLEDQFPFDASEHADHDGDGIGNNADDDDDGDGTNETYDCNDRDVAVGSIMEDLDCDEEINDIDIDDDGDNVEDIDDFCPYGETNWTSGAALGTDVDGDGCRDDGEDIDDDGDGIEDGDDGCPRGHTGWTSNPVNDIDGDGCHETEDYDRDGDGFSDIEDAFPENPAEWNDSDGDGVGDNTDAYPDDSSRWEIGDEGPSEVDDGDYTSVILVGTIFILIIALVVVLKRK